MLCMDESAPCAGTPAGGLGLANELDLEVACEPVPQLRGDSTAIKGCSGRDTDPGEDGLKTLSLSSSNASSFGLKAPPVYIPNPPPPPPDELSRWLPTELLLTLLLDVDTSASPLPPTPVSATGDSPYGVMPRRDEDCVDVPESIDILMTLLLPAPPSAVEALLESV